MLTPWQTQQIEFLRHGAVDGPAALYGRSDPPLSCEGWKAFEPLFTRGAAPWQRIISSPRQRCAALAERLAAHYQLPLEIRAEWAEMDFGQLDGKPFDALKDEWPQLERFWLDPLAHPLPDAEPLTDFHQRVVAAWQALLQHESKQSLLVICHGGVIRQLLAHLLAANWQQGSYHQRLRIPHASVTRIKLWFGDGEPHLQVEQIANPIKIHINQIDTK